MLYSQEKLERPSTKGYLYSLPTHLCRFRVQIPFC
ncbi:hypothetical protein F383_05440 [Gossypium arboreum]|uniref:Uncharacterized protein n=1 Tax=Gossypium arboreum TaxID=29729 RepID=A0A0B0P9A6_GOSAR|nr:hypothetical protein F383_07121 [Gossypium arboreum]KHG21482.1 hypothetical protein F383_09228 [Gossypium arboreum]KHG26889.1 hypothetical protein F383_05440 [Gossypium arboreum]